MRYLLNTNSVIALQRQHPIFLAHMRPHASRDFVISAIVAHELFYGAYHGPRPAENLAKIDAYPFAIADFTSEDARRAGEVRAALAKAGTPIGPYDVLIAGQALARDLTLITHNTREFQRVAGLRIEDWLI